MNIHYTKKQEMQWVEKKNFTNYEFSAQYLIFGRIGVHTEKPVMRDGSFSTTYIKVKTKQYLSLALRASYGYQQYNLTNLSFGNTKRAFDYKAYNVNNPSNIIEDINGSTMYIMKFVSFGLGVLQKQDLKIKTDIYGTKDYSMTTTYYFDLLLPISQELTNMEIEDRSTGTPIYYEVNVNDYTDRSNYGFRAGMKFQTVSNSRKINSGSKFELGFLPGPGKLTNNFYISLGLNLNMSFKTYK